MDKVSPQMWCIQWDEGEYMLTYRVGEYVCYNVDTTIALCISTIDQLILVGLI